MKKIVILALLATLANAESDIALTWGHNSFNDDKILFGSASFYGLRGSHIVDDTYGLQVGFEQTRAANCQGLTLRRYYVNGILQKKLQGGLTPYGLATVGYETSSKEYRPSQLFTGLGAGIKYRFENNVNFFLETRALKSMDTEEMTWATTLGLGYLFDTASVPDTFMDDRLQREVRAPVKYIEDANLRPIPMIDTAVSQKDVFDDEILPKKENYAVEKEVVSHTRFATPEMVDFKEYYVQIISLTTSSPAPSIRRVKAHGFSNVQVKRTDGRKLVLVGPYHDRNTAEEALRSLRSVSHDAFIKHF